MYVSTELLIWKDAQSRAKIDHVAVLTVKFVKSNYLSSSDSHASHFTAMLSTASAQFSAAQQNRVGALVTHHPAWMSYHTGGSRQGHPRYTSAQTVGRPWVARPAGQSAAAHRHRSKSYV